MLISVCTLVYNYNIHMGTYINDIYKAIWKKKFYSSILLLYNNEKEVWIQFNYAVHLISTITIIADGCRTSTLSFCNATDRLIISYNENWWSNFTWWANISQLYRDRLLPFVINRVRACFSVHRKVSSTIYSF